MDKGDIYQIKITLEHAHIPIWRMILIRSDATFANLHEAIQIAFGWTNSHMHRFTISTPTMQRLYIQSEQMPDEFAPSNPELLMSEERTKLKDVLPDIAKQCEYTYDFGDSWTHRVEFEEVLPEDKRKKYPLCIEGENAGPPEDCGGVGAYEDLCTILNSPTSEEYEEKLEWLGLEKGSDFDSHAFDMKDINVGLRKGLVDWVTQFQ